MKMCKKTVLAIFAFTLLLAISFPIMAAPSVTIYVDPSTITVLVDETFTLNITITAITDLYGWDVRLYYRNDVLNATQIVEGPFLKTAGKTNFLEVYFNDAYNATHGRIIAACMLVGPIPGANGSGTLTAITFKPIGEGNATIDIYFTDLIDSNGKHPTHSTTDGQVTVISIVGDVNHDGIVDIYDLVKVASVYGSEPGDSNWDPYCDVNHDGIVDIFDLVTVASHYGEENP